MPEMPNNALHRACNCLNVRIAPQPTSDKPPDFLIPHSEYVLTYVGAQGISITHPQVTMRTRKIGPLAPDALRCVRFTTLTCLLCQTATYRVQQLVASDMDGQEGSLLPSPDWVEQEVLLSTCGWIEVHKNCLLTEQVTRLSSSPTFSSAFGIALPHKAIPTVPQTKLVQESPQASPVQSVVQPGPFLYNLKPLFPPAPFVPSHSVFTHLSSIAVKASEQFRSLAEEQIAAIVRDKYAELEKADDRLRLDVEVLWRRFVENLSEVETQLAGETKKRDTSRGRRGLSTSGLSGTPLVSVRSFVPTPSTAPRTMSPTSSRRVSSLSVSLANSGFCQGPVETPGRPPSNSPRSPPPYSSHPSSLGSAGSLPLSSSPQLSPRMNGDNVVQPFKRSMDETRDTAASFRYFTILEADVARTRQQQTASQLSARSDGASKPANEKGGASVAKITTPVKEAEETHAHRPENPDREVILPADGTPRRRKVKFDITAEGVAGDPEANGEARENQELIFDLEDGSTDPESSDAAPTLPFIENAQSRRRGRHRVASHGTLPASLSSLRPTSLPAYSDQQSKSVKEPTNNITNNGVSHTTSRAPLLQEVQPDPEQLDPQEEEILKLVAASIPSHRSAWKRNSKAWQLFVSRRRNGVPGALIPEETEDGSGRLGSDMDDGGWNSSRGGAGFATSLPIDISPLARRREPLTLASYQPKTSLSDRAGLIVPALPVGRPHIPSPTLRKASYARAMDPGTLDFLLANGEEAEDDESDDEPGKANTADEGRGRQRAFKILQARSKIPEAGMWMSLA